MITTHTARPLRYRIAAPVLASAAAALVIGGATGAQAVAPAAAVASPAASTAGLVSTGAVPSADRRHLPHVVTAWASAWNDGAPQRMAALFTADGTYQDFAFGAAFHGRKEIASWVLTTHTGIDDAQVRVTDAFRAGDRISVRFTFSGHIAGAPAPFSVPASTVMELQGNKIAYTGDFYNLADVLHQSGLPADRPQP